MRKCSLAAVILFFALTGCSKPESTRPSGSSETPSKAVAPIKDVFTPTKSPAANYPKSRVPGSFYVRLIATPVWQPNTRECVDYGFWSWLRLSAAYADAAQVGLFAQVSGDGMTLPEVPLFMLSMNENAKNSDDKCVSHVKSKPLTPYVLAQKTTQFTVIMRIRSQQSTDFKLTESLSDAATGLTSIYTGNSWILQKLASAPFASAAKRIDNEVTSHWGDTTSATFDGFIPVFVSDGQDWADHTDGYLLSGPTIEAKSSGLKISQTNIPTTKIALQYYDSIFAVNGVFPAEPSQILLSNIGIDGLSAQNVDAVVEQNVGKTFLARANASDLLDACQRLRASFSQFLSDRDMLAQLRASLRAYSHFDAMSSFDQQATNCFSIAEKSQLASFGDNYGIVENVRATMSVRDKAIAARMKPIVAKITSNNEETIKEVFVPRNQENDLIVLRMR